MKKDKISLYFELALECLNLREKSKTAREFRHYDRKADRYMKKAIRGLCGNETRKRH